MLCLGLFCGFSAVNNQALAQGPVQRITVLNPLGTPPPIKLKSMAPRLDTLDGKTIYIVDDGFDSEDPQLWAEIKEKGNAVIIGLSH
jgi:hypothetical protein